MIFSQLSFDYAGTLAQRGYTILYTINALEKCRLSFQCVNFRDGKMLVEVLLDTDEVNAPRNEMEAEEEILKEVQKAEMDCTILIISGTEYVNESERYEPKMTLATQLRTGEG